MDGFNFVVAFKKIYDFVWNEFFNKFLEITKFDVKNCNIQTISILGYVLKQVIILLHPFIPFVTEEIYQHFPNHLDSIICERYPIVFELENINLKESEVLFDIIGEIRKLRKDKNLANKKPIYIFTNSDLIKNNQSFFDKYLNANNIFLFDKCSSNSIDLITNLINIQVNMDNLIDNQDELNKLESQLKNVEFEINRCHQLLFNPNFIQKAPKSKIDLEKEKLAQYQLQYSNLKEKISKLKK